MYVEIFNRDIFGPEKPIIVDSDEYGIKDKYLAARNFIINTLFNGKVNIDRIIVIETATPKVFIYNNTPHPITFKFSIDKFTYGRPILKGDIAVNKDGIVIHYNLKEESNDGETTIPLKYCNIMPDRVVTSPAFRPVPQNPNSSGYDPNQDVYKITIGDSGRALDGTIFMNSNTSVNESANQLDINDPAVISSVLSDIKKKNNQ